MLSSWALAAAAGLTSLAALVTWLVMRARNKRLMELAARLPGPDSLPILGNALDFDTDPENLMAVMTGMIQRYGDVVRVWMGPDLNIIVSDPDELKALLSNPKMSVKGPLYRFMQDFIGGGILSGSGPSWRRHRKIASPNYGKKAIEGYTLVFNKEVAALVSQLQDVATGDEVDIYNYIVRTTSYSVCQTLMALSKEETMSLPHLQTLIDSTEHFYTCVFNRMTKWYYQIIFVYWFTDAYKFYKRFRRLSEKFAMAIIDLRKKALKNFIANDFNLDIEEDCLKNSELGVIDRFILSNELNRDELIGETYTIFTSSQEASAKISSFMLLMMAYHPEYQDRLYEEITSVLGDNYSANISGESLKKMVYLDRVFRECLRLFPIGAIIQRTITEEVQVGEYTIPAGCSLVAPIYQMSRDPRYWERPDDFYPDHFAPHNVSVRPANSYLPFSVGPMDCLGRYFGEKLIKMVCVAIIRQYKVTSHRTYKDLRLKVVVSVTPKNGYKVSLHPRT